VESLTWFQAQPLYQTRTSALDNIRPCNIELNCCILCSSCYFQSLTIFLIWCYNFIFITVKNPMSSQQRLRHRIDSSNGGDDDFSLVIFPISSSTPMLPPRISQIGLSSRPPTETLSLKQCVDEKTWGPGWVDILYEMGDQQSNSKCEFTRSQQRGY
jgi:hypothetical protein